MLLRPYGVSGGRPGKCDPSGGTRSRPPARFEGLRGPGAEGPVAGAGPGSTRGGRTGQLPGPGQAPAPRGFRGRDPGFSQLISRGRTRGATRKLGWWVVS